jgi:Cu+-exporting ATPase
MEKSIACKVDGMTCGNCAMSITNYLQKEGVKNAVANSSTGDLSFTIDDESKLETLYAGIENLGFKVNTSTSEEQPSGSKLKPLLLASLICWIPLISHMFLDWSPLHQPWVQLILTLPIYAIGVHYFGRSAWRSLRNGIPNMDVLVFVGSSAAFFYSIIGWYLHPAQVHQYMFFETTASIITLVLAGNFLEEYSVRSTASSIKELMKYQKTKAKIIFTDSIGKETIQEIDNEFVKVNDVLQVNTGDKIPVDGIILQGEGMFDESMMTGESLPVLKTISARVIGGTILHEGSIRMKTTAVGSGTAFANIIKLVNQAQAAKPAMQRLADKISAIFVPLVIGISILTFLINYIALKVGLEASLMRSIAVLVISCPCAMGLATPAAVMVGLGRAARNGILIKGGDTLEKFKEIRQFVFDKTGTLTTGKLIVSEYQSSLPEDEFKSIIVSLEQHSSHPIARSILNSWSASHPIELQQVSEQKGIGLQAKDQLSNTWQLGSFRILPSNSTEAKHDLHLLKNGIPVGWIDMKDELREGTQEVIEQLNQAGHKTFLLSGDRTEKCQRIARELNIQEVYSEKLPEEKLSILDDLLAIAPTAMVGDGINDAPSLAKATIGISLSDATQIAMQSANVILLKNNLSNLPTAIGLGRHTFLTIKQNLFWAFFYNIIAIPVAAAGYLTPTWGAAIMGLSDVVLILNSLRLRYKRVDR